MLRADPRRDKALLLQFSVEINDVAAIRQIDTYLDKLTQLKQAFAVFQEAAKKTAEEVKKTAGAALFSTKAKATKKAAKKKASNKSSSSSTKAKPPPKARTKAMKMAARTTTLCDGLEKIADHYRRSRISRNPKSRQTPALLTSCACPTSGGCFQ